MTTIQEKPKKTSSQLRKDVYDFVSRMGVRMDSKQQSELSSILKSVYEHRIIESRKENDAPIIHQVVCPKCQGIKIKKGRAFKNYKKQIKKAGGVVDMKA